MRQPLYQPLHIYSHWRDSSTIASSVTSTLHVSTIASAITSTIYVSTNVPIIRVSTIYVSTIYVSTIYVPTVYVPTVHVSTIVSVVKSTLPVSTIASAVTSEELYTPYRWVRDVNFQRVTG